MIKNTKNKIKISFYPEGQDFKSFSQLFEGYLITHFKRALVKYTNNFENKLTIENLIDIQCDVERDARKDYVLTGKILDFNITQLFFAKNLKSVNVNCSCYTPSWYATSEKQDELDQDDLDIRFTVEFSKNLKISKNLFDLDITECEKFREEECSDYAHTYNIKRPLTVGKKSYKNNLCYFVSLSNR